MKLQIKNILSGMRSVETVGKVVVPALDGSMNAVESVGSVGADVLDSVANTTSKTLFNGGEFIGEVLGRGMDNVDDMINDIDSASDFIATLVLIPFVPAVSLAEVAFEKVAEKERAKLRRKEKRYEQTCNNLNNEIRNHFTESNENISKEFIKNKLEELHAVQSELQAELKDVTDASILSSGNTVPTPTNITCAELAEPVEGCLAKLPAVTVAQGQDDHGQWLVTDGAGVCQIDDGFFYLDSVDPVGAGLDSVIPR